MDGQYKRMYKSALIDPALPLSGSNALVQLTGARGVEIQAPWFMAPLPPLLVLLSLGDIRVVLLLLLLSLSL